MYQGQIGGGSTWHSAGLISQLNRSAVETRLSRLSKELYMELESKGYFTGWKQVGSVYVAQTKERLHYYKRYLVFHIEFNWDILSPIPNIC